MNELSYALRRSIRQRGFSLAVILMLAVGIGVTTAIFSLLYRVLFQPLPVWEPEGLVNVGYVQPGTQSSSDATSYPIFRDLEEQQSVFTEIAAHSPFQAGLSYGDGGLRVRGEFVSGSYFQMLGLRPSLGRLIAPQDAPRIDESPVVVLGHDLWRNRFGSDPNVVGRRLTVNGELLTVIGVAPQRFAGSHLGIRAQLFVPLTMQSRLQPGSSSEAIFGRGFNSLWVSARLRPGIDIEQAAASLNSFYSRISRQPNARIALLPGNRGWGSIVDAGASLAILFVLTLLVVLIICINVANLLFAHGVSRAGEMAIRESLGASRGRLLAQLLAETAVPAAIGGALSLPVAAGTLAVAQAILPASLAEGLALDLDRTTLLFASIVTAATALLSSVVPALRVSRASPVHVIKNYAPQALGGHGAAPIRNVLVTAQIALSMALLALAGLFAQSLVNITRINLGVEVESLVRFNVWPRLHGYTPERISILYEQIQAALTAHPGVTGVTSAAIPLIAGSNFDMSVFAPGSEYEGQSLDASVNIVDSNFFETLSIELLAGRQFTAEDLPGPPSVAIVNERFARNYRLPADAVGKYLTAPLSRFEIVGVVADVVYSDAKADIPPQLFLPRTLGAADPSSNPFYFVAASPTFYVRASRDPDALLVEIPRIIASIDPTLPVTDVMTMRRQVQNNVFFDRIVAILSMSFAVIAALLAAIGLYGVLSFGIAERTRELGLRLALGAKPSDLFRMVLRHVAIMAATGIVVGTGTAIGFGRLAESLLYGLSGSDARALVAAAAALSLVALVAAYLPARRAAQIVAMDALRWE